MNVIDFEAKTNFFFFIIFFTQSVSELIYSITCNVCASVCLNPPAPPKNPIYIYIYIYIYILRSKIQWFFKGFHYSQRRYLKKYVFHRLHTKIKPGILYNSFFFNINNQDKSQSTKKK